mmetsp:Transcript_90732/g.157311  ORF Transcript_90732/g.157311 Transcript_90732/m.157311 type:complete len:206 (-) Transcript_90732:683-1300(-)
MLCVDLRALPGVGAGAEGQRRHFRVRGLVDGVVGHQFADQVQEARVLLLEHVPLQVIDLRLPGLDLGLQCLAHGLSGVPGAADPQVVVVDHEVRPPEHRDDCRVVQVGVHVRECCGEHQDCHAESQGAEGGGCRAPNGRRVVNLPGVSSGRGLSMALGFCPRKACERGWAWLPLVLSTELRATTVGHQGTPLLWRRASFRVIARE